MTTQDTPFFSEKDEHTTIRETLRYVGRTLLLIWHSSPRWSVMNMAMIMVRGAVPLLVLWAIMLLVDNTMAQVESEAFDLIQTLRALGLVGAFLVVNPLFGSVHEYIKENHRFCLQLYISNLIHSKTTTIDYEYYEDATYQNVFFRTITDSLSKPQNVFYNITSVMQSALTICAVGSVLFTIHWLFPLIILVIGIPILLVRIRISRKLFKFLRSQTSDERRTLYYERVLTSKEFAKELRIFGLGNYFRHLYRITTTQLHKNRQRIVRKHIVRETLTQIGVSLLTVGLFGAVVYGVTVGAMTVGALAMYFMAMYRCYGLAISMLQNIASLYESNLFLRNFFFFIDMPTSENTANEAFPRYLKQGISVKNVSFKYSNTERTVLQNISFDIHAGETVAILGANGSGKSTLIKLLCGLYKPTKGTIEIDGIEIEKINSTDFARNVSAIFQDFMLYNASATDNIRFGDIRTHATPENVRAAAQNAGIDGVFANLKNGYDTQIGFLTPESEMLSQGEWQRTALARSFFNNSQIIVLDEPTASLDIFTEAQLVNNFRQITHDRTAIIVSHRMSTIRMADRIIMLRDKQIAEVGTYDELMKKRGYFFEMVSELDR